MFGLGAIKNILSPSRGLGGLFGRSSSLGQGTYDFGGGFRNAYDPVTSAQSVGRRPKRINMGLFNDRDLRTAPRPDAPMLTRQVPEEYEELVNYQDPDYYNYVRNTPDLRKAFENSPEAKALYEPAWDSTTGKIDESKLDGEAFRDAAIKFGEDHYTNTGKGEGRELPMIDRQRYETKERMIDELYEGPRPDREQLFDTARNAISDRLYNNFGRQREFNPYNFDSYSPSRRAMGRGPLNMGMDSLYGMPSPRVGRMPGFGMQPFNPYGGGFGRRGMFGGMPQQAPFGGMFGGFGGVRDIYDTPFSERSPGGGPRGYRDTSFSDYGMSGGMFGGIGRGLGSMFSRPGMGGAMDPFMTPRGGGGMFRDRRSMQSSEGGLPEGYSYEQPKGMAYSMDMPKNGGRWAYGPEGDRIEVGGKPSGKSGPFGLSFLKNLFG